MAHSATSLRPPSMADIRDVFPNAIGGGFILPELRLGLHVQFRKLTNIFQELSISPTSSVFYSRKLYAFVDKYGFVNLKNCFVPPINNRGGLSQGKNEKGQLLQDPLHSDFLPLRPIFATAIYPEWQPGTDTNNEREEPTEYALEEDVRSAIARLPTDGLPAAVVKALSDMIRPDYRFRLYNEDEMPARQIVQSQYPNFVDDVLKLIPEERRFSKQWKAGVWSMVVHSNDYADPFKRFLHGRATGHPLAEDEVKPNPLRGLEIYRG